LWSNRLLRSNEAALRFGIQCIHHTQETSVKVSRPSLQPYKTQQQHDTINNKTLNKLKHLNSVITSMLIANW
jgi:hypothetical protein